jgi:hypothetical protein
MSKNIVRILPIALVACMVTWFGCKKDPSISTPAEQAHFTNLISGSFQITAVGQTYKIPVGLTTVSDKDRTVNITVTSPTGAVQGTHYTLNKTSFVIPAGKVLDSIVVGGVFAQYTAGRKDSLIFNIASTDKGGLAPSDYNQQFILLLRGPCFEGEVSTSVGDLAGDYNNTIETFGTGAPYGPYKTTVKSVTVTSSTTANIVVSNLFDDSPKWNDMTFKLDWTDINNRTVTFATQNAGGNASGLFGAAYNNMPYGLRPIAGTPGTFSYCNQRIQIIANIGVFGVGYSGSVYTVNMAR